ncbi:MAG: hypothetical protein OSJ83_03820 [Clostridia bacterium]|nr:hypothetical protein [Clostridia bacterium]
MCYNHDMSGTKALKAQGAYSRPEGPTNFVTYVLAAVLSFVGLVFLLIKASGIGAVAVTAAAVCGVLFVSTFTVGALVHILPSGRVRDVLRGIDRHAVAFLVVGAFAPVLMCGLSRGDAYDAAWGFSLFGVAAACCIAACTVTVLRVKHYKIVCLVLYVAIGLAIALRAMSFVRLVGIDAFWWLFGGGAAYLVGAAIVFYGKFSFGHTLMHLSVAVGAALHFVCVYLYVL